MTTGTRGEARQAHAALVGAVVFTLAAWGPARALQIDDRGEMRLGMRAYTAARVGTERMGGEDDPLSYPSSGLGHLRQHRTFLELRFDHDIKRLTEEGWGLARALGWLHLDAVKYNLQYRGEWEGLYDYGPTEFSNQGSVLRRFRNTETPLLDLGPPLVANPVKTSDRLPNRFIYERVAKVQRNARARNRFFQGYLDVEKGPVFLRIGRQVLAWGETDQFRLLDNINPLDASFGGFLIPLDERRVPLDMIRGSYQIGSVGFIHDSFVEAFGAFGNSVATFPGIPAGSVWQPGGLNYPNPLLVQTVDLPAREDWRGGARMVFNAADVTYSLAYYETYLDVPGVAFTIPKGLPSSDNPILATQHFPRVGILGGSLTFPVPSFYLVVRSEGAWFRGEPMNRQGRGNTADGDDGIGGPGYRRLATQGNTEGGLNPFVYPGFWAFPGNPLNTDCSSTAGGTAAPCRTTAMHGQVLKRDTFNWSIGFDHNRFIRWINPDQTILFTTQFFYKHVFDSPGDLVLPVPYRNIPVSRDLALLGKNCGNGVLDLAHLGRLNQGRACRVAPRLFHLNDDQFLHTLAIFTSYFGGRLQPAFAMFYDWQGSILVQPGVTLVRDPFRVAFDYTRIEGPPTGTIGTLRDRDNVRIQFEYVF